MAHKQLPEASAARVRAMINGADDLLTQSIKRLPGELLDGKKTKDEVEGILCHTSKIWAMDVFSTILRQWAEIGISPADFEAIAKEQIESLSVHAEERIAGFVELGISSALVFRTVSEFLPCLMHPYREENRFRFQSVTAGGELPNRSRQAARPSENSESAMDGAVGNDKASSDQPPTASGIDLPDWLTGISTGPALSREYEKGSLDHAAQTDPIWRVAVEQEGPIQITRLTGKVDHIDTSLAAHPAEPALKPQLEVRIAEVTFSGRSQLRTEIESAFAGESWPPMSAIVAPMRSYAVKVFDVNADAHYRTPSAHSDKHQSLSAMARNLLVDMFGNEWEISPGEQTTRIDWDHGKDGWKGREIRVRAGNDADPNCLYHQVVGDAVTYRYRFHAPPPPPAPGEPPGINVTNLEWWEYIGLKERHNVAMAVRPYIEDRLEHWKFISAAAPPTDTAGTSVAPESGKLAKSQAELAAQRQAVVMPILTEKRWSRGKLVTKAGIGKNSVYGYLDGKRNPGYDNRKAMAEALGLTEDQLPQ